jgi:ankyrin repeat protein
MINVDIDSLKCPITRQIYNEPVVCSDGFIYEKEALKLWIKNNDTSPITREYIKNKEYYTLFEKKQQVKEYLLKYPEEISEQYLIKEDTIEDIINYKNNYEEILINKDLIGLTIDLNKILDWKLLFSIKSKVLLKNLINIIINLECCDNNLLRPIHYICQYSTSKMIKYIINKGVNLECVDKNVWKPIHYICRHSTPKMIKYIIDKGVDLESINNENKKPIHLICQYSTPEMIKYIIDKGVDLECVSICGHTPIHLICGYSTPEMIKYIIDKGVNLEFTTRYGWKPLHIICNFSTKETIEYIINIYIEKKLDITSRIKMTFGKECNFNILDLIKLNNKLIDIDKEELINIIAKYQNK